MLRFVRYALVATIPLLLLLAACGGDDDDDSAEDGGGAKATATATADESDDGGDDVDEPTETDDSADDGDDDGGDSDYYNQIADLLNQADSDVDDISSQYGGPYDDDQDEIDQTRTAVTETGRVVETAWLDLADLEPPSEAESAHTSYLDVLNSALANYASLSGDLEDVETRAEFDALIEEYSPLVQERNQEVEDACLVIQGLADDAGTGADLTCTE